MRDEYVVLNWLIGALLLGWFLFVIKTCDKLDDQRIISQLQADLTATQARMCLPEENRR